MSREVLFDGEDVLAYSHAGDPAAPLVITFGALPAGDRPDRQGFGDSFLHSRGFNAIHVVPLKKQWYQTPEMATLLPLLQARRAGFGRCVTYGSSMGAYAALLYAARLDADSVIALAPQVSVDPKKAGFDQRWAAIGRNLHFIDDDAVVASHAARDVHIFYDPLERNDRRHAQAFARPGASLHRVPFAGHQVAGTLAATGCLKELASDLITGQFAWQRFTRKLHENRRNTVNYWRGLFIAAVRVRHHPRFAAMALDGLIGTGEAHAALLSAMARIAMRSHRFELALKALDRAVKQGGDLRRVRPLMGRLGGRVPSRDLAAIYAALPGTVAPPVWAIAPIGTFLRLRDAIGI